MNKADLKTVRNILITVATLAILAFGYLKLTNTSKEVTQETPTEVVRDTLN